MEGDSLNLQLNSVLNGHHLFCHLWKPRDSPRAMLCVCHGVTEHAQRYQELAELLAENHILVFANDHVGHGRSEGERVCIDDIDIYVQDVIHHILEMKQRYPDLPCLLMGHSMGGLIASHVAVQRQELIHGLILSSPPSFHIFNTLSRRIMKSSVSVLRALVPHRPLIPWDARKVSSMPQEVAKFVEDPLIYHGKMRFCWVNAIINSLNTLEESLHKITLPTLIIHGSEDPIIPISSSEHIYEKISSIDKIVEVFVGNYHEVLHDLGQVKARGLIKEWILSHLS